MASSIHSVESLKTVLELTDDDFEDEQLFKDADNSEESFSPELSPFVPTSPGELVLAFIFVLPSITFILYLLVVFYRCVCSRNYAEWRTSWEGPDQRQNSDMYTQVVQESVPIHLDGHNHEIESLITDGIGNLVVSLCLDGRINTWDSYTGENLARIERNS